MLVGSIIVGHFFMHYRLPLLSVASRAFLALLAGVYGHFLEQAARYFCADNITNPFEKVVAVRLSEDLQILGFATNADSDHHIVFVPTSPNPTSGVILRVNSQSVQRTQIDSEEFLRYTLTSGAHVIRTKNEVSDGIDPSA
jgi:uncharacterized membrane protein